MERGNKKREMDELRRENIEEKGYKIEEKWKCEWWEIFKPNDKIKNYVRTHFPYKTHLFYRFPSCKLKYGSLVGFVHFF